MKFLKRLTGVIIGAIWDGLCGSFEDWKEYQKNHGWPFLDAITITAVMLVLFYGFIIAARFIIAEVFING